MTHPHTRTFFLCFARRGALHHIARSAQFFLRILMLRQYWKRARCLNGICCMADATQSSVSDGSHIIGGGRTHPLLLDHHRELWTMFTKATCAFGHDHGALFRRRFKAKWHDSFLRTSNFYQRHGSRSPCKSNEIGLQVAFSTSFKNTKGEERAFKNQFQFLQHRISFARTSKNMLSPSEMTAMTDGSMRFEKCVEAFQSCSSPLLEI